MCTRQEMFGVSPIHTYILSEHAFADLKVAAAYEGPIVVSKGPADIITDGCTTLSCEVASGLKRSGGQGDILAGVIFVLT